MLWVTLCFELQKRPFHRCQDSQILSPETPYFPKPPCAYPSLFFAILCDLSRFFAIPRYENHKPSRPTLFIHFVLLTSFLFSLSRLSGKCEDDKTVDDIIGTSRQSQRRRDATKDKAQILSHGALDFVMLGDLRGVAHLVRPSWRSFARRTRARSGAATDTGGK